MDQIIKEECPRCGEEMLAEGVSVGIGYYYPPFHCMYCGYSEGCGKKGSNVCKKCDQYEYCYKD